MTLFEAADLAFGNLQPINTLTGFIAGVVSFCHHKCDVSHAFECLARGFTYSTLPSGLAFVFCAAYPAYVTKIPDVSAAFLIGGSALVFMPFLASKKITQVFGKSRAA